MLEQLRSIKRGLLNLNNMKRSSQQGIGLVEVLIASSIIVVGVLTIIEAFNIYVSYALANNGNVQAAYLMEEGLETMTFFRDNGWTTYISKLSTTTTYYLKTVSSTWATTTTQQYVDSQFVRKLTLTDVNRDASGYIVSSGGTYDPNTKKITVTIEYSQGHATTTRSMSTYIANINND